MAEKIVLEYELKTGLLKRQFEDMKKSIEKMIGPAVARSVSVGVKRGGVATIKGARFAPEAGGEKEGIGLKKTLRLFKLDLFWRWIKGTWLTITKYTPLLGQMADLISNAIGLIFTALLLPFLPSILEFIKGVYGFVGDIFKWTKGVTLDNFGTKLAEGLNSWFGKIDWGKVGTDIGNSINAVIDITSDFLEKIDWIKVGESIGNAIANFITSIDWINLGKTFAEAFWSTLKTAVGIARGFREKTGITLADPGSMLAQWLLGKMGIGKFANGGIITQPTMGLVGEAGPEAIIPLDKMGGIGSTNIKVFIDGKEFRGMIREEIERSNRRLYNNRGAVGV